MTDQAILTLVLLAIIASITGYIAHRKGASFWVWALLACLFAIVALPVAIFMKPDHAALQEREIKAGRAKRCPYCMNLMFPQASICPHCHQWVMYPPPPYYPPY